MSQTAPFLAVAIGTATMAQALERLATIRGQADRVELRLDAFHEPYDLAALLEAAEPARAIVTLRPVGQGGASTLSAEERFLELRRAASLGAGLVDVEWDAATPERVQALKREGATVIVSRHDFEHVPSDLAEWWEAIAATGADVVKVVGMARTTADCRPVLNLLRAASRPTIAFAMGPAGIPTRLLCLREPACFLTFGAVDAASATAPGQVSLDDLRDAYAANRLRPTSALYGILSPRLERDLAAQHNGWFLAAGLDAVAVPIPTDDDAPTALNTFGDMPFRGWHVHGAELQETIGQALDRLDGAACRVGRVNSITVRDDGSLQGGWVESPAEQFQQWTGRRPA